MLNGEHRGVFVYNRPFQVFVVVVVVVVCLFSTFDIEH